MAGNAQNYSLVPCLSKFLLLRGSLSLFSGEIPRPINFSPQGPGIGGGERPDLPFRVATFFQGLIDSFLSVGVFFSRADLPGRCRRRLFPAGVDFSDIKLFQREGFRLSFSPFAQGVSPFGLVPCPCPYSVLVSPSFDATRRAFFFFSKRIGTELNPGAPRYSGAWCPSTTFSCFSADAISP